VVVPASSTIDVDDLRMTVVARWRHLPMRDTEHVIELRGDPELPGLVLDLRSIW